MTVIGQPTPLLEGGPKVRGSLRYAGDLYRPGMLHARLVTSPYAHARVQAVDLEAARQVPGVAAVLGGADLPPIPPAGRATLMLARDRVMFVGHPVALVLAESAAAAEDGAEAVTVEYEPLPAAISLDRAMAADAPPVWPEGMPGQSAEAAAHGAAGGDANDRGTEASPNVTSLMVFPRGDLEHGFAQADVVIEREFRTERVHQSYLEPHVTLVDTDPMGRGVTVWTSTQATYNVRDTVASVLGLQATEVTVVGTPVGGGFGGKFVLYEPLLAIAAHRLQRPVRLVLSRSEEMLAATPAPATRIRIKLGATNEGVLTALEAELIMESGCFPTSMTVLAGILLGSNYKIPNQKISGAEVLTNKPSAGAYRAPCAPQAAFALETALDELAKQIDIDPIELRLRNGASPGDAMATGAPWPSMGLHQVLKKLQAHPAWQGRDEARRQGRGVGIALGSWPGGTEPAAAACSLQPDGTVQVHVASADITGSNTSLALIASETFGVEPERVRVTTGNTSTGPYVGASGGSKTIYTLGPAVLQAAQEARRQTMELAAQFFEADPEDLEIKDGSVQVKGSPDKALPLAKIAQRTMSFGGRQAPVYGHGRHAQLGPAPGFCAQLAEVSVDSDTGAVKVDKLIVVQDVGKAINPATVEGQMLGGAMQGIGWALLEQMSFDEDGQLLTATLTDYALPHFPDLPGEFEAVLVEVASESGPFGARGVGEPPVIATAAAIANAIADATGARLHQLPMTPPLVRAAVAAGRA